MPDEQHEVSTEYLFQRIGMLFVELELVRAQRDAALATLETHLAGANRVEE